MFYPRVAKGPQLPVISLSSQCKKGIEKKSDPLREGICRTPRKQNCIP